ncbi:CRE-CDH-12 protein [Burkholderiales bacterium GJ-E10]|nr:CRE-CDH-12 protein [Burkholderiales bacterium GJ-E10]
MLESEIWESGSHRSVDRLLPDGRRLAFCEVYSGALDSLEQANAVQHLIAAAPDLLGALRIVVTDTAGEARAQALRAIAKATGARP